MDTGPLNLFNVARLIKNRFQPRVFRHPNKSFGAIFFKHDAGFSRRPLVRREGRPPPDLLLLLLLAQPAAAAAQPNAAAAVSDVIAEKADAENWPRLVAAFYFSNHYSP